MNFTNNIRSVAHYESKLLMRSWFFKVFAVLSVLFFFVFNFGIIKSDNWPIFAIPSNYPYFNIKLLNIAQSIIVIFLSSEFLKRDKKLDTSEVFYVRPLSNAEYMLGKVWGNLQVFFLLNILVLSIALIFNLLVEETTVDPGAYAAYFLLVSVPSLVYIMGLSIFLMLVLNSQAVTFVVLLGYIGVEVFYLDDKVFFLFDYMAFSLPMTKSLFIGFSNLGAILIQRAMYLMLGAGFIFFTISLFRRLPNSRFSAMPWVVLSAAMFAGAGYLGYLHLDRFYAMNRNQKEFTAINNKYANSPAIIPLNYTIDFTQGTDTFSGEVAIEGIAQTASQEFVFTLNPGLRVTSVEGVPSFRTDKQIIIADAGRSLAVGDTLRLKIAYTGAIDETFCYLDIPQEVMAEKNNLRMLNIDKRYAFVTPGYVLLTPETAWYPRPGVSYATANLDWQQAFFSNYTIRVKPREGLVPVSNGTSVYDSLAGVYTFTQEYPMKSAMLAIGDYQRRSLKVDSIEYSAVFLRGHDKFFANAFDSITDTIPSIIRQTMNDLERRFKFDYPFRRFSLVEVPVQFFTYQRSWSEAQETAQPEMILFPEKGYDKWFFSFDKTVKNQIKWRGTDITIADAQTMCLNWIFDEFEEYESGGSVSIRNGRSSITAPKPNPNYIFPQFYNFRYNIYSPEWTLANRLVEMYIQSRSVRGGGGWLRQFTGISDDEKVNMLTGKRSFIEIFNDPEYRNVTSVLAAGNAYRLFAEAELNYGIFAFRTAFIDLLKRQNFGNISFEKLIDTLGAISSTDISKSIEGWDKPVRLPRYVVSRPVTRFIVNRGEELYQTEITIGNVSETPGIVRFEVLGVKSQDGFLSNGSPAAWMMKLEPYQTKTIVAHYEEVPRSITVNTMMSGNLPSRMDNDLNNILREGGRSVRNLRTPGVYVVSSDVLDVPGEIIVDNEDSTLFSLSSPAVSGYLTRWIGQKSDTAFRYSGMNDWSAPFQWTPVTDSRLYGTTIRSGYTIRGGKGDQYAVWTVPIPEAGRYELYYYVRKPGELRQRNNRNNSGNRNNRGNRKRSGTEYLFEIGYSNETEDAYLDLNLAQEGWAQLGVYHFAQGTITVKLKDKTNLRAVTADAVKLVRR